MCERMLLHHECRRVHVDRAEGRDRRGVREINHGNLSIRTLPKCEHFVKLSRVCRSTCCFGRNLGVQSVSLTSVIHL